MSKDFNPTKEAFNALGNSTMKHTAILQLVKGLQSIPLIGGIIPDYRGGQISPEEIRGKLNKAYAHIDELTAKERAKLNSITNQANELGLLVGSPALMSFINQQKAKLNKQYDQAEKKVDDLTRYREHMRDAGDDLLNAPDIDKIKGTDLHKSFEQAYENSMNIKGD